jgi:hypothetical protein
VGTVEGRERKGRQGEEREEGAWRRRQVRRSREKWDGELERFSFAGRKDEPVFGLGGVSIRLQ